MFVPHPFILLIDDDEDDLEILSSSLKQLGIKTKTFISGVKAAYYIQLLADTSELPALIIVDYNMPGMNGQQFLDSIKGNHATKDIPVVVYSTSISHLTKKTLIDKGAFSCYVKPFTYSDFITQVGIFKDLAWSFSTTICLA